MIRRECQVRRRRVELPGAARGHVTS
ncbi:MAG: hypothetical protein QOI25_3307, partial [Mycobacterium sp.]|nr:hypothetical protein [Mycobacterium sp.]